MERWVTSESCHRGCTAGRGDRAQAGCVMKPFTAALVCEPARVQFSVHLIKYSIILRSEPGSAGLWEHKGIAAQDRAQRQAPKMHLEGFVVGVFPTCLATPRGPQPLLQDPC